MIIFFNKKTKEIIGTIAGRVHSEDHLKMFIKPGNVSKDDIGKYVVPFKENFKLVEEPIVEQRVVDKKTMRVGGVIVGKRMAKKSLDMTPDVPFAKFITNFETGKDNIYNYRAKLDGGGQLVGFLKKKIK